MDANGFRIASILYACRDQPREQIDRALRESLGDEWDAALLEKVAGTPAGEWILGLEGASTARSLPIRARIALIGPSGMALLTTLLAPLFSRLGLWLGALIFLAALPSARTVVQSGVSTALSASEQACALALTIVGMLFHELGHSTAARSRGVVVGEVGVGLYWGIPAFYADVTNVWTAGRGTRVLTDLGGAYLQGLFIAALVTLAVVVDAAVLTRIVAVAVMLTQIALLHTLNPGMKFDGYWLLTDLFGTYNLHDRTMRFWQSYLRSTPAPEGRRAERAIYLLLPLLAGIFIASMLTAVWTFGRSALLALQTNVGSGQWIGVAGALLMLAAATLLSFFILARLVRVARQMFIRSTGP